ncbi:MAG: fused isobutyryl-CoA mutase/GTPase IcmF [Planctomycetota bacterium]
MIQTQEKKSVSEIYSPQHQIRIITATSLFDGHDASINIIRRLLQFSGAEVIHLGHNRSANEIVTAAIQEDASAICISSYQGGHNEFFRYIHDLLLERGSGRIKIFGGGGGVILPREIKELETYGITKIFSPKDGQILGLQGMINVILKESDFLPLDSQNFIPTDSSWTDRLIAHGATLLENQPDRTEWVSSLANSKKNPVVGLTGTGGAGKSSLTDELVRRYVSDYPSHRVAILSIDPTWKRSGGALLGDRIRMNSLQFPQVFMRSLASRDSHSSLSKAVPAILNFFKKIGFDIIFVETAGIGQSSTEITDVSDFSIYVMTEEYGASTQLEKINMLAYADMIVLNKFDRKGSEDALRAVQKQFRRNYNNFQTPEEQLPIFGAMASQFNDPGVNRAYRYLIQALPQKDPQFARLTLPLSVTTSSPACYTTIIPPTRIYYLGEIVTSIRKEKKRLESQIQLAREMGSLLTAQKLLKQPVPELQDKIQEIRKKMDTELLEKLETWDQWLEPYRQTELVTQIRDQKICYPLTQTSLSGIAIPKVALPSFQDWGERCRFLVEENLPGHFPFTAGVFPLKRTDEIPLRQFAGEGGPARTNQRFHYLSQNESAKRLSTAFDSVTLYGEDPDLRPDIYGKIGESGVSICTLEDMKTLYKGFDLCDKNTSVSMTINGPAPIILAMFLNTAIDQQIEKAGGVQKLTPEKIESIRAYTLATVRGTVQADILKEDQAQNTCIFSTQFALKMMGDIAEYFVKQEVRNYYSVSISGYHIAEAGANPISQLAFTLANGFTYLEYYLSRGMSIDDCAKNLSFFFSNGLDPEYTVLGRVARRIWARAISGLYHGNERSQKLKYHIQTSGRSLHAQEVNFNDIRTTLQALIALADNCNSLHTNAYDEAVTTPTEESVRRAMAIQLILTREFGGLYNENNLQGSFFYTMLTDKVEEAVLAEFERLNHRGGVLGAMETQYQRSKIQEESMHYERLKNSGALPIIGVNTFLNPQENYEGAMENTKLSRSSTEEKNHQLDRLKKFKEKHQKEAPLALAQLKQVALQGENIFSELMNTVRYASLGQISTTLYEVGGQYRRNL